MQAPRFISPIEAVILLREGVTLQQWICVLERGGFRFIRWVELNAACEGFDVYEHESLDAGPQNRDMTSFYNDLDPDYPEGVRHSCKSAETALAVCERLGCKPDRFLRHCEIQALYDTFIALHGPPERDSSEYFVRV
jgi:hypothetical protein